MPRLNLEPCQNCQKRHLKCDGLKPICSRCKERGEQCRPNQVIQYRSSRLRFADDQPWPTTLASRLRFVDETPDLAYYYNHDIESRYPGSSWEEPDKDPMEQAHLQPTDDQTDTNLHTTDKSTAVQTDNSKFRPASLDTVPQRNTHTSESASPAVTGISSLTSDTSSNKPLDLPRSFWSDKEAQDACLMRYFVEELAPWFDTCDTAKHFALVAPHRAKSCPPLLYAIYSASARHLSRRQIVNGSEILFAGKKLPLLSEETALEYQSLCISHLMSLFGDSTEVQDENLLAAAVILRFYEEYDAPLIGIDDETYLRGTQVFLDAQSTSAMQAGSLRHAAFWVAFRQEFHRSFIKQRVFRFNSHCCASSPYRSLDPADDNTWTNRMVLHCTDVLTYCYAGGSALSRYDELWAYTLRWQSLVPSTFNSLYSREPDPGANEVFPEIWYLDDCIVTAMQHCHIVRMLLLAFDPRVPRMGPNRKTAVEKREAEIKWNLFSLCGIARSNKTAPALVMACMGVTMCGDRVTDRVEQEALLGILMKLEEVHAFSSETAQVRLREAWAWSCSANPI